jgi:hypothetical protein
MQKPPLEAVALLMIAVREACPRQAGIDFVDP